MNLTEVIPNILNEESGVQTLENTQTAGGNVRKYKVLDKNVKLNVIKSCCSSKAALKAFGLLRKKILVISLIRIKK